MNTKQSSITLPLVSIIIITYNSSAYVTETLDSALRQTYEGPIELIISDDCSYDNTLDICRGWVERHQSAFVRTAIVRTPSNCGVCSNYNYALRYARGEWIKYIAGDDILTPQCISRFVDHATHTTDSLLISGVYCFDEEEGPRYLMKDLLDSSDAAVQAYNLANAPTGIVEGPTFFIRSKTLRQMGGMDMRYPMLEDFPFAFRYTSSGGHIHVIKEPLVRYRVHSASVSRSYSGFKQMYYHAMYDARMRLALRKGYYSYAWHNYIMATVCTAQGIKSRLTVQLLKLTDLYGMLVKMRIWTSVQNATI